LCDASRFLPWTHALLVERARKEKKNYVSSKTSHSHQLRKKGHLGRKAPSPEKGEGIVSEDQEGCEQTSQQTAPD